MATILLIEDNLEIRENLAEMLELAGHEVLLASNGIEGMNIAANKLPQIILSDIMMPKANGYEVIKTLKANSLTSHIPFIFLTASTEPSEMQAGLDLGADAYIRKPFEEEELMEVLSRCLSVQTPS